MTTIASRIAPRGSAARDLVAVWLTVTAVLTYLDVPLRHSPLFATNLVLQASLGTVVITGLLRGLAPSLLLLCGPGLVLGGSLSFAVYHVFGRGTLGAGVSACLGIVALVHVSRRTGAWAADGLRWWQLGQVIGMAMLALSSEFGELLPAAALLFLLGFVNSPYRVSRLLAVRAANLIGLGIAVAVWSLRQNYWWLVTDDYLFLEVVSRHITNEGPFASWGVINFARYHWLSYGWAGILDVMSGSPAPLVTLTRVMPIVYAISMASSVVLVLRKRTPTLSATSFLFAWTVIAFGRFDWSGTSTGGVYAVLAAAMFLGINALELRAHRLQNGLLGFLVFSTVIFTKFPSVFSILLVSLSAFSVLRTSTVRDRLLGRLARWAGLGLSISTVAFAILVTSRLLDGQYAIASRNPGLGQLSTLGAPFTAFTLGVNRLSLWVAVMLLVIESRKITVPRGKVLVWLTPTFILSLVAGLLCELFITANADNYSYFGGPFYFVASLSILFLNSNEHVSIDLRRNQIGQLALVPLFLSVGVLWGREELQRSTWSLILKIASVSPVYRVEVLLLFAADRRIGSAFIGCVLALLGMFSSRRASWVNAWVAAFVFLTFSNLSSFSIAEYRRERARSEIDNSYGSEDERAVGRWFRSNTASDAVIATNSLFRDSSRKDYSSNFSLAMWSRRRFLVMGPKFANSAEAASDQINLCVRFADNPSSADLNTFHELGVGWFIVDSMISKQRNFTEFGELVFVAGRFWVLRLRETVLS